MQVTKTKEEISVLEEKVLISEPEVSKVQKIAEKLPDKKMAAQPPREVAKDPAKGMLG